LNQHQGTIHGISFFPDGKTMVSGSTDSMVILWDFSGDIPTETCSFACRGRVTCLAVSQSQSRFIAVGDGSGTMYKLTPIGFKE
jgi:WD40 repeat protein